MSNVLYYAVAILGISLLVIVHEAGHYFVARAFGMRVLRFSIGFGQPLIKYQPKGSPTVFQICLIPVLAYVQIAGMNPAEEIDPKDPGLFPNKSLFARVLTIFAGPLANYLMAAILIFFVAMHGWPGKRVRIEEFAEGPSAARDAGLMPGDRILRIEGKKMKRAEQVQIATSTRAGRPTDYLVERNGRQLHISVTPALVDGRGMIGVRLGDDPVALSPGAALKQAFVYPYKYSRDSLKGLIEKIQQRSTEGLSSVVGMTRIMAAVAERGVGDYIFLLLHLSIAIGFFNLLPLPALDGGRLFFLAYEAITRRRPNEKFEAIVHAVGIVFFLAFVVYITIVNDLRG